MPYRIILASDHTPLIRAVMDILRLLSLSFVITLTTDTAEAGADRLQGQDPHLLILGFSRASARKMIREARARWPRMKVLWLGESAEPLPEADASVNQPLTALRLIDGVSKALRPY